METVAHIGADPAPRKSEDFVVTDDLAGMPVTDAELDVVEAFLSGAFRDLLTKDSETTQTHAEIAVSRQQRGAAS